MTFQRHLAGGLAAASLLAAAAAVPAAAETINVSSWLPPQHTLVVNTLKPWAEEVEKRTDGRVTFRWLPKPVAAPPSTVDAVRDGLADMSYVVHGFTPGRFVLTKAIEFPGMGESGEISSIAYQRVYEEFFEGKEDEDLKVLAVFAHSPGYIYMRDKAVTKLEDLDGTKLRVGGGLVNDLTKELGVSSVLRPPGETYEILANGVVDGVMFPPEAITAFKSEGLIKHVTTMPGGFYRVSFLIMMNRDKFDSLSPEDQAVIEELSGVALARSAGHAWDIQDAKANAAMDKEGIQRHEADPALVAKVQEEADRLKAQWKEEVAKLGVDGDAVMKALDAELAKARAEVKQQ